MLKILFTNTKQNKNQIITKLSSLENLNVKFFSRTKNKKENTGCTSNFLIGNIIHHRTLRQPKSNVLLIQNINHPHVIKQSFDFREKINLWTPSEKSRV